MESPHTSEWDSCVVGFTCEDTELFVHILHSGMLMVRFFWDHTGCS